MKRIFLLLLFIVSVGFAQEKISPVLKAKLSETKSNETIKVWIYFTDKGNSLDKYYSEPQLVVSKRSLARRAKVMPKNATITFEDLPVNNAYVQAVKNAGAKIHHRSRWFNAVSAYVDKSTIETIANFPFVKGIDIVRKFKIDKKDIPETKIGATKDSPKGVHSLDYGASYVQNEQINVPAVHDLGFYGQGVMICLMDAGFNNLEHEVFQSMNIHAAYDFVNNDDNVDDEGDMGTGDHGTETLSTIGGYKPGNLIGPAFGAVYLLAKTENTDSETPAEEDNWIAAAEWADSIGVDVTSTSLGYIDMDPPYEGYTWQDMDGNTATITIGADLAVKRGIVVLNSAGNEGDNDSHNTLGAPADGDSVIAVGAVNDDGSRTYFSSVGPTVDGRIKPDIMAMGSGVHVASPYSSDGYTSSSGTSFSCPLSAGVAALVLCANPGLTPMQVRDALRETASRAANPDNKYGWGIIDALAAINYFRVQIEHTPLTDTEDPNRPNVVEAELIAENGIDENNLYVIYSLDEFATFDSVALVYTGNGNVYSATLPSFGEGTMYYYIKAANSFGQVSYLPLNAPQEYFEFTVGPDTTPPAVQHTPITVVSYYGLPWQIKVNASDNIGIASVEIFYKINGGTLESFELTSSGDDIYTGYFPIDSNQVSVDDEVQYRVVVTDMASNPNIVYLPDAHGFYEFTVGTFIAVEENFDENDGDFTQTQGGDWEWGEPNSAIGAHSEPNVWGTKLNGEYSDGPLLSSLQTVTYTVYGPEPKLNFWHWYNIEEGYDGGNVKVSVNNGDFTIIEPESGYDDDALSDGWGNPMGGEPAFTGESGGWIYETFDLSNMLHTGDEVVFRFDFGADQSITKTGWFIDDFSLQDIGKIVVGIENENDLPKKFALEQNYPNPFNPTTTIKYSIPANAGVETQNLASLRIYNILGEEIATLVNKKQSPGNYTVQFDASNLPSGVYFYTLRVGDFVATKKMILLK